MIERSSTPGCIWRFEPDDGVAAETALETAPKKYDSGIAVDGKLCENCGMYLQRGSACTHHRCVRRSGGTCHGVGDLAVDQSCLQQTLEFNQAASCCDANVSSLL